MALSTDKSTFRDSLDAGQNDQADMCVICRDDDVKVMRTCPSPCSHVLCASCLDDEALPRGLNVCPMCQTLWYGHRPGPSFLKLAATWGLPVLFCAFLAAAFSAFAARDLEGLLLHSLNAILCATMWWFEKYWHDQLVHAVHLLCFWCESNFWWIHLLMVVRSLRDWVVVFRVASNRNIATFVLQSVCPSVALVLVGWHIYFPDSKFFALAESGFGKHVGVKKSVDHGTEDATKEQQVLDTFDRSSFLDIVRRRHEGALSVPVP